MIINYLRLAALISAVTAASYFLYDYRAMSARIEAQKATITRLEGNIKVQDDLLKINKFALNELDSECAQAAKRFQEELDVLRKIAESTDPLTDAANFATKKDK